jgi:hypothetical protein
VDKNAKNGSVLLTQAKNQKTGKSSKIREKEGKQVVELTGIEPATS